MSAVPESRHIRKFNPGMSQSDKEVIAQFVVRNREFKTVMDVLRGNIDSISCQHILLIGPRGRGKTMLLARVAAELRNDDTLSQQLLPVRFMEESHEIFDAGDFWLETLFYLARELSLSDPDFSRELKDVHAALASEWRVHEVEERARAAVLQAADRLRVQLVLMVENMQALSSDVDGDFGWKLRKVLQSEPKIVLIASATSRFKGLDDAKEPFFELFRTLPLDPLDTEGCRLLWQAVGGDPVSRREVRPLQILTGGSPRLLVIIGEFAEHRSLRQLMEELVRLIDDHTEYFRGHLERFSKTERRVYLAVIDLWQPSRTGEIAERARMDVRAVSTLLGRLVKRGAVIVEGNGRQQRMYMAAERLYSIYYKLRRERDEAAVIRNLIRFMVVFYTEAEMAEMAGQIRSEAAEFPIIRQGIERAIADSPDIGPLFFDDERQTEQTSEPATPTNDSELELILGEIKSATMRAEQALADDPHAAGAAYEELVKRFGNSDMPEVQIQIVKALFNKGSRLRRTDDPRAAITTYDELIRRFWDSNVPEVQVRVAGALRDKGSTLGQIDDPRAGIATYDELVHRFGNSRVSAVQIQIAAALLDKGFALERIDDRRTEIATYDELIEKFMNSDLPEIQSLIAQALFNKAIALERINDPRAAIASYDELVEQLGDSDVPQMQPRIATALINKASTLGEIDDPHAQMATCNELVERFGSSDVPVIKLHVARSFAYKAKQGIELGQAEEALRACDELERRVETLDDDEKATLGRRARWLRTEALLVLKRRAAAMDEFRDLYALFDAGEDTFAREMLIHLPKLIAARAREIDLVEVLCSDRDKADFLLPIVVALRQRAGEAVRAPAEVQEVAADIREMIDEQG